jgi:hypothetical protein
MKSKIAGCTHHTSKVLKMAGGGSVPGKLKTMGPPNVKEIQKKTDKNPDGSQQYVRGKKSYEKLDTLIKNSEALEPQERAAKRRVKEAYSADDATFKKALDDRDRVWNGGAMLVRAFIDEANRKEKK